jgi:hypothetical protein
VITFSNKKCGVVYALKSFTGVASTHVVKYFIAIIIYLAPDLFASGLIGPTKSISHFSNTYKVTCGLRGISSSSIRFTNPLTHITSLAVVL